MRFDRNDVHHLVVVSNRPISKLRISVRALIRNPIKKLSSMQGYISERKFGDVLPISATYPTHRPI